jgi:hypothetical protein
MDRAVLFHPLFATDIAEAAAWYDARGDGLGDCFCDAVEVSLSTIIADPDANSVLDGSMRYRQLRGFPFLIVYETNQSSVRLYTVVHTARSPEQWRVRLT